MLNKNNLFKQGYMIANLAIDIKKLIEYRNVLENLFKTLDFPDTLWAHEIKSHKVKAIFDNLFLENNKYIISQIINAENKSVLFPPIHIMRNYLPSPMIRKESWHTDSGGETRYQFCRELLQNPKYSFGKVAYYLQENSNNYGGGINVVPTNFRRKKNQGGLRYKFLLLINKILRHTNFYKIYDYSSKKWLEEKIDFLSKKIKTNSNQILFFDSRTPHRGSFISKSFYQELKQKDSKIFFDRIKSDLFDKNKYSIYLHYGNKLGLESYMYDRSKRKNGIDEFKGWYDQYQIYSEIFGEKSYEIFVETSKKIGIYNQLINR